MHVTFCEYLVFHESTRNLYITLAQYIEQEGIKKPMIHQEGNDRGGHPTYPPGQQPQQQQQLVTHQEGSDRGGRPTYPSGQQPQQQPVTHQEDSDRGGPPTYPSGQQPQQQQ